MKYLPLAFLGILMISLGCVSQNGIPSDAIKVSAFLGCSAIEDTENSTDAQKITERKEDVCSTVCSLNGMDYYPIYACKNLTNSSVDILECYCNPK